MTFRRILSSVRTRRGNAMLEAALATPMLCLMLTGVIDMGRAFYFSDIAAGSARAGAQYGIISSVNAGNLAGMENAAWEEHARQVPATDSDGQPVFTATASYFCQDSAGNVLPNCKDYPDAEAYVRVVTRIRYKMVLPWRGWFGGVPDQMTVGGISVMRVQ